MKCPYCANRGTKVMDKRESSDLISTRRRRECLKCGERFTTYERIEPIQITVVKKNSRREPYERDKLKAGLVESFEKRPFTEELIDRIVHDIEKKIKQRGRIVSSKFIGDLVLKKLKAVDKVAYIRFASVYKSFDNPNKFKEELKIMR